MVQSTGKCGHKRSGWDNHTNCLSCCACSREHPCVVSSEWSQETWDKAASRRAYRLRKSASKEPVLTPEVRPLFEPSPPREGSALKKSRRGTKVPASGPPSGKGSDRGASAPASGPPVSNPDPCPVVLRHMTDHRAPGLRERPGLRTRSHRAPGTGFYPVPGTFTG